MDSTFCIDCGHSENDHNGSGWGSPCGRMAGTRRSGSALYALTCGCSGFVSMDDPYATLDRAHAEGAW